jgi:hypothetical protein
MGWAIGQPNNVDGLENCAELTTFGDGWNDVPCAGGLVRRSLCERGTSS